jgi:N6-L-threonylcarbamoyladenine synthase
MEPLLLAVETSCDETGVALLRGRTHLLANEIASQTASHAAFGGVVPEVASRAHLEALAALLPKVAAAAGGLGAADAFAATIGPGLATSLLVGAAAAKGLAAGFNKPFIGVNHLEGHLLSPFFDSESGPGPSVGLIVSGGHTLIVAVGAAGDYRVVGRTRDDAAGEAFDKAGKMMGLPYPAGPAIDRLAREGDPTRFPLPRARMDGFDFSFSGIKTAVRNLIPRLAESDRADLCASFQEAVVSVLVERTVAAARHLGMDTVTLSGGVSANGRLREQMARACDAAGCGLLVADPALCTDNAAMIARVAAERFLAGQFTPLAADIDPGLSFGAG